MQWVAGSFWLLLLILTYSQEWGSGSPGTASGFCYQLLCGPGSVVEGPGFPVALPVMDGGIFWKYLHSPPPLSKDVSVTPGFAFL